VEPLNLAIDLALGAIHLDIGRSDPVPAGRRASLSKSLDSGALRGGQALAETREMSLNSPKMLAMEVCPSAPPAKWLQFTFCVLFRAAVDASWPHLAETMRRGKGGKDRPRALQMGLGPRPGRSERRDRRVCRGRFLQQRGAT